MIGSVISDDELSSIDKSELLAIVQRVRLKLRHRLRQHVEGANTQTGANAGAEALVQQPVRHCMGCNLPPMLRPYGLPTGRGKKDIVEETPLLHRSDHVTVTGSERH